MITKNKKIYLILILLHLISVKINAQLFGGQIKSQPFTVFCNVSTAIVNVTNPTTGKIWMDRNLGATQVATSSTDANAYGNLYQWGRGSDGHQCRTSAITNILSSSDQPGNSSFIAPPILPPTDWRSPQNSNLWQGVNGINNPCPTGYRLPTEAEWIAEDASYSTQNAAGAYASPLKLPVAGTRGFNGSVGNVGVIGACWSSTASGTSSRYHSFSSTSATFMNGVRAGALSVRCIKN